MYLDGRAPGLMSAADCVVRLVNRLEEVCVSSSRKSIKTYEIYVFYEAYVKPGLARNRVISPRREGAAGHTLQFLEVIPIRPNAGKREVVP